MPHSSARRRTSAGQLGALGIAETGGGFVEQQDRRLRGDGAGDPDQPAAPERQVGDRAVQIVLERRTRGSRRRPPAAAADRAGHTSPVSPDEPVALVGRGAQVLEHGQVLEELERLERARHARTRPAVGGHAPDVRVAEPRRRRRRCGRSPVIASMAEVFPAPFGPIRPTISPGWTSSDKSVDGDHPAVAHLHVVDPQDEWYDHVPHPAVGQRARRAAPARPAGTAPATRWPSFVFWLASPSGSASRMAIRLIPPISTM